MADPEITPPTPLPPSPPVPQRNDPETFEDRFDAGWEYMFDTLRPGIDATAENVYGNALAAQHFAGRAADAETAATQAEEARDAAQGHAEDAEDYKNSAANFAAAAGAAAGVPAMEGKEGMALVVEPGPNPGDPPVAAWGDPVRIGSVIKAAFPPDDRYIETGKTYLQSAYPRLFDVVGVRPDYPVGSRWDAVSGLGSTAFQDGAVLPNGTMVAVGGTQQARRSLDDGQTWALSSGLTGNITGVIAVGESTFLAFGTGINGPYRSTNEGASFALSGYLGENMGVNAATALSDTVVLIQAGGQIRRSTDSGGTWTSLGAAPSGSAPYLFAVSETRALHCSLSGMSESDDAGSTWSAIPGAPANVARLVRVGGVLFGFSPATTSSGGTPARLFRSFDEGKTWQQIAGFSPVSVINTLTECEGRLIAAGTESYVIVSDDLGLSWQTVEFMEGATLGYRGSISTGSTVILLGGWTGTGASAAGRRSVSEFLYDTNTMFHVPYVPSAYGYKSLIKAA